MNIKNRTSILDPVDVVTGEFYLERVDFTLPGPIPLEWKAYYSSQYGQDGPLGRGWMLSCHRCLIMRRKVLKTFVFYFDGQGCEIPFVSFPKKGREAPSVDGQFVLKRIDRKTFQVVQPDGLILSFQTGLAKRRALLTQIADANGNAIRFFYKRKGVLLKIEDSAGRVLEFVADKSGHIQAVYCKRESCGSMRLASYRYDANGDQVEATDAEECGQLYEYDGSHRLVKRTDRNGYSFHYRYAGGRCVKTWGDDGLFTGDFSYDPENRRTTYTGFDGRKVEYRYNDQGFVTEQIDPYQRSEKTVYDADGNAVAQFDRCGRPSAKKYDGRGNATEEITASGQKTTRSFNERSQVTEETDPRGRKTVREYDQRGNLLLEKFPDGRTVVNEYDRHGRAVYTKKTGLAPEYKEYDRFHQLVCIRNVPDGDKAVEYEYDLLGNMVAMKTPDERILYKYDRMSRLLSARYSDGTSEKNTFDPEGNITSYADRLGFEWTYRYTSYNQMCETVAPDGGVTQYSRNKADELCKVVDPNMSETEYVRDMCDRIVEIRRNGRLVETYERDPEGRLLVKRDPEGRVLAELEYGVADLPASRSIQWRGRQFANRMVYDKHGEVQSADNEDAQVFRQSDAEGRIVSEQMNGGGVVHEYDEKGRLVKTVFGDGVVFSLEHADNAVKIIGPDGSSHTCYLDGPLIVERWLPGGVEESRAFDDEGRLVRHLVANGGPALLERHYSYDVLGRLAYRETNYDKRSFEYDEVGRLVGVRKGSSELSAVDLESYSYDLGGNLYPSRDGKGAEYLHENLLSGWGERKFFYDDRKRLKNEDRGGGRFAYSYDSSGQLESVALPDGKKAEYAYDALRRRVSKRVGEKETRFGWEGDRLSWESTPDGTLRCYFYLKPEDHNPAMFCDVGPETERGAKIRSYFVHYDQANRPVLILDGKGCKVWSAEYTAYGLAQVSPDSTIVYNRRAPGQYFDAETSLHYNYHRYYDPQIGRFTQPDLIGLAGGMNLYSFGEGNPFAFCDVLGLKDG